MSEPDDLSRFVSNVSADRLSAALGIACDIDRLQNWEIEVANGDRTEEFFDYYARAKQLSDDDKFALMALVVASFDDWSWHALAGHPLPGRLREALISDFRTHAATIKASLEGYAGERPQAAMQRPSPSGARFARVSG